MYNNSDYTDFKMRFKKQIENGMTMSDYLAHHIGDGSSEMFADLQAEVEHEKEMGEAFLKGFLNKG